jgi:hypothetical protein
LVSNSGDANKKAKPIRVWPYPTRKSLG